MSERFDPAAQPDFDRFCRARAAMFYPKTSLPAEQLARCDVQRARHQSGDYLAAVRAILADELGESGVVPQFIADGGTTHAIYRCPTPTRAYVLRVGLDCDTTAWELLADARVGHALAPLGDGRWVDAGLIDLTRRHAPFDWQLLPQAEGNAVRQLEDARTQYLPPALLKKIGAGVAQVHSIKTDQAGLLDLRQTTLPLVGLRQDWRDHLLQNVHEEASVCQRAGLIDGAMQKNVIQAIEQAEVWLNQTERCLLHGDLANHNLFVAQGQVSAIIDWEDALSGDPVFDLAYWGTFCRDYMLKPFLDGYYGAANQRPHDEFELRYWLYYLRISLAKTVYRWIRGIPDRPNRPQAHLRIYKAVDHLRAIGWV